ncbi:hypothetical protein ENKO_03130 [Enterobacter kobei]|uniref:Uncharacterized protein n=1 Tax=Enterobacter kobei TaxID=208224 RepID=A0AA86IKZ7_9ENTR|nr:hypothetical protein ENKO_03130 [Enterobacter kobei]
MRREFRSNAIPYLRIQSPSVQQHKMTLSFSFGFPPQVIHQLGFSSVNREGIYAISAWLMLAMPNAAGTRRMGYLFGVQSRAVYHADRLPAMWFAGGPDHATVRPLPAKTAAVAATGDGE